MNKNVLVLNVCGAAIVYFGCVILPAVSCSCVKLDPLKLQHFSAWLAFCRHFNASQNSKSCISENR